MAYSTSTPPQLLLGSFTNGSGQVSIWNHYSADTAATARVTGFITNAEDLGMKVGDIVLHRDTGTNIVSTLRMAVINANGSGDLADATTFASGTNSD